MRKNLLIAASALTVSCGAGGGGDIPVLDVTASYPERNIALQDIATVEYLPLETREGFLIDYPDVHHIDEEIVVCGNQQGDIMIFDRRTGRGLTSFNRQGRGPGEYLGFNYLAVDRAAGEIIVAPNGTGAAALYPVYVYDKRGGEFFEGMVFNADIADTSRPCINQPEAGVPGGGFTMGLPAHRLVDWHAEGKLNGPLAEIAANLKEDDNPVMMIVTFK